MKKLNKLTISGSFGPNAVVETGQSKLINIAGGHGDGDFYQEVSNSNQAGFSTVQDLISKAASISSDQKLQLQSAVEQVQSEILQGINANYALVQLVLQTAYEISPMITRALAQAIVDTTSDFALSGLALDYISKTMP
jgi:hypothetical protein